MLKDAQVAGTRSSSVTSNDALCFSPTSTPLQGTSTMATNSATEASTASGRAVFCNSSMNPPSSESSAAERESLSATSSLPAPGSGSKRPRVPSCGCVSGDVGGIGNCCGTCRVNREKISANETRLVQALSEASGAAACRATIFDAGELSAVSVADPGGMHDGVDGTFMKTMGSTGAHSGVLGGAAPFGGGSSCVHTSCDGISGAGAIGGRGHTGGGSSVCGVADDGGGAAIQSRAIGGRLSYISAGSCRASDALTSQACHTSGIFVPAMAAATVAAAASPQSVPFAPQPPRTTRAAERIAVMQRVRLLSGLSLADQYFVIQYFDGYNRFQPIVETAKFLSALDVAQQSGCLPTQGVTTLAANLELSRAYVVARAASVIDSCSNSGSGSGSRAESFSASSVTEKSCRHLVVNSGGYSAARASAFGASEHAHAYIDTAGTSASPGWLSMRAQSLHCDSDMACVLACLHAILAMSALCEGFERASQAHGVVALELSGIIGQRASQHLVSSHVLLAKLAFLSGSESQARSLSSIAARVNARPAEMHLGICALAQAEAELHAARLPGAPAAAWPAPPRTLGASCAVIAHDFGRAHAFLSHQIIDSFPNVPGERENDFLGLLGTTAASWDYISALAGTAPAPELPSASYYLPLLHALWAQRAGDKPLAVRHACTFAAALGEASSGIKHCFSHLIAAARLEPLLRSHGELQAANVLLTAISAPHQQRALEESSPRATERTCILTAISTTSTTSS